MGTTATAIPVPSMDWKCIDCKTQFQGPTDAPPPGGCPACGSRNCFDINVAPDTPAAFRWLTADARAPQVPRLPAPPKSARLAARLYEAANNRTLTRRDARALLREAADEIQRLQQLPLL